MLAASPVRLQGFGGVRLLRDFVMITFWDGFPACSFDFLSGVSLSIDCDSVERRSGMITPQTALGLASATSPYILRPEYVRAAMRAPTIEAPFDSTGIAAPCVASLEYRTTAFRARQLCASSDTAEWRWRVRHLLFSPLRASK
jgi:hypothetical protein